MDQTSDTPDNSENAAEGTEERIRVVYIDKTDDPEVKRIAAQAEARAKKEKRAKILRGIKKVVTSPEFVMGVGSLAAIAIVSLKNRDLKREVGNLKHHIRHLEFDTMDLKEIKRAWQAMMRSGEPQFFYGPSNKPLFAMHPYDEKEKEEKEKEKSDDES